MILNRIFFQMDLLILLVVFILIQTAYSQLDNDGNDIDNDQVANIAAFGNVITPIKGNKFVKQNNGNSINHFNKNSEEESVQQIDTMPEMMNDVIGLAGLGCNAKGVIIGQLQWGSNYNVITTAEQSTIFSPISRSQIESEIICH